MVSLIPIFVHQICCFFDLLKNNFCLKSKYTKKNDKLTIWFYRKSQKISRKNLITVNSGLIQTRFVISSDEQITNCDLTDYYYNMDFVRNGKIQGSSLVFFKAHCSCISPLVKESPLYTSVIRCQI